VKNHGKIATARRSVNGPGSGAGRVITASVNRGFLLALTVAGATSACSVYDSSLLSHGALSGSGGASGSTGSGGTSAGGDTTANGGATSGGAGGTGATGSCQSATGPRRPPPNPDGLDGNIPFTVVQSDVDLGDAPTGDPIRYNTIGFDLDGLCTTQAQLNKNTGQECKLPSWATPSDQTNWGVPDGPNGQDNAIGANIQFIRDRTGNFSSANYTDSLKKGASNAIVRVERYNGQPNDDSVSVTILTAGPFDAFTKGATPKWDGTDKWPVNSSSYDKGTTTPSFVDSNAYVSNGKLVASLNTAGLRLLVSLVQGSTPAYLTMILRRAYAVCDLKPSTLGRWGWTLENCTLAGAWRADDLLHQIAQFPDILTGAHLCRPAPGSAGGTYLVFKGSICNKVDLFYNINDPTAVYCDAMSIGVKFNTVPGDAGDTYNVLPVNDTALCPPGQRPSDDSCQPPSVPDAGAGGSGAGGAGGSKDGGSDASSKDASTKG